MSAELLRRLEEFDVDGPAPAALPFAARLAREAGWDRGFAGRAVGEYKRFLYLAATAGEPVCPSEEVDQVWHLHLTYTRSYWHRLCRDVLGQPVHHDPTKGGPAEAGKHRRMYDRTLALYRRAFGEEPPADVWPPADVRFGPAARGGRVDRAANWVVPKAPVKRAAGGLAAAGLVLVFATGCGAGLDPFGLKGAEYLGFLIPTMVAAVAVGFLLRSWYRGPGPDPGVDPPDLGWEEAAYLAGGPGRLFGAAVASLTDRGHLRVSADGNRLEPTGPAPDGISRVEAAVFGAAPLDKTDRAGLTAVHKAVEVRAEGIADRLRDAGLVPTAGEAAAAGLATATPLILVLLVFGLTRLGLGLAHGKPVGYLLGTLAVGAVAALVLAFHRPKRTLKGDDAVARLRAAKARLKDEKGRDAAGDLPLAVALFGTAVLAGSALPDLHRWYPRQTTDSGSGCGTSGCGTGGGGDGGGGDGGGCGSGCGGCGGGD